MIAQSNTFKIMVIDDEVGPRESLRILFKEEFVVECCKSVEEGIEKIEEFRPHVLIMDIRMPGKSGIEGLREIRQIDEHVSIVMVTGFGTLHTAQEALRLGANDYMTKPFDTDEMLDLARRYANRCALERRRVQMLEELREINARLVDDLADKDRMASLMQSSAEIVHDLRSPLMVVSGYVQLLSDQIHGARDKMGCEYDKAADYLDTIGHNVHRCCELSRMWDGLRNDGGGERHPADLGGVMQSLVTTIEPLADSRRASLECRMPEARLLVRANPSELLRALNNVITNSLNAVSAPGGAVTLACRNDGDKAEVTIRDNGDGMPSDVLKRIFEPYFTTRSEDGGTGLGMAITKRIVENHGGTISVESSPGSGTVVTIYLPLVAEGMPATATA
ncbi:MAG: hybrid sensor histidine kinase/response regulator [Lentisphaerae bacterium]|nr:hybrid sensor histidine kinase/response regulator [Lentisphaerota bacterium]